ncbi:MAG: type IX secretion system sortase PorU [Cytophagales bacterium]|nr:type IX secretion system sortase PorU [Cytophagales bacterium]
MAQSDNDCSLAMLINGSEVGSIDLASVPSGSYTVKGSESSGVFPITGNSDNIEVKLSFTPDGTTSIAYFDWFSVSLKRFLILANEPLFFRSLASLSNIISSFEISGADASVQVWEVTNPTVPLAIEPLISSDKAIFSVNTQELGEFVAFSGSSFDKPTAFGSVPNQSIQSFTAVDGIIVTHPNFLEQAQRLADFRLYNDNLSVNVVTTREVYNEFSSGMQDVSAIRDYAKYIYDVGGGLSYLLLFGDGSYDYKYRVDNNTNFVPIYESRNSLHPVLSHSSDDYFGFLEPSEGEWIETAAGDHTMEIGVGRLPVKTAEEAEVVVDKIIRYASSTLTLGKWRNEILYIADDGDGNIHTRHGEDLSEIINQNSVFNIQKIYLDAFEQQINPSNERSTATNRSILDAIERGAFLVNYIGHGSEKVWMHENVLTTSDIEQLTNFQKLPIFVTATCEFGRYDDPTQISGAERLILSDRGAIALLTTTRPVFASTNFVLNQAYHQSIIQIASNRNLRLGDVIRETKNNSLVGAVNRNFALLGDPMMRPAYPRFDVELDQFKNEELDTLSALEKVDFSGSIVYEEQTVSDFNGKLDIILFDIPTEKITRGQQSSPFLYTERDNALFRGEVTVTNGQFSGNFIIPKNISYQNQSGKLSLYAWDESGGNDAIGLSKNFVLGGTNQTASDDSTPPSLEAYLNEPSFKNGSTVGSGALLIAKFFDESGMNISYSGFERGITLNLNGEIIELNDFYTANLDDFTNGTVMYPLPDLEPGQYTALIKGADTYNNSVEEVVEFVVSNQPLLQTFNFSTYPNPASTFTNFTFDHDREGEPLRVEILVYSMNGNQVDLVVEQIDFSERNVKLQMDFSSRIIEDGLYVYRIIVKSRVDGASDELVGRLVIRN